MAILERIAFFHNRRDELPNQLLAKELAETKNHSGIMEIGENLKNRNKNVRSDCLKVLYEIGYLDPHLIENFTNDFLELIQSKDNRMVWGAMIALATIADQRSAEIWTRVDEILRITSGGTVITKVWGIRVLAKLAAVNPDYKQKIVPFLFNQLRDCLPRDVPTHTESILGVVDQTNKKELLSILDERSQELTPAQLIRFKRVLKQIDQR
jgi:hypothetical protein